MRREDGVVELAQGAVRAGLAFVHVDADRADLAGGQEVGERLLVEDAAARGVHQDHAVLHSRVLVGPEHPDGLLRLGKVDGDEVGQRHKGVHVVVQRHAQLLGALGAAVRVVAHEPHAEGTGALGHEAADAAEAEDGERLLVQLHAGVLPALPDALVHGRVRLRNLARAGKHEADGVLGGGHDVGRGRVAHDDAVLGGRFDVHVVHAHAGAPDDAQAIGGFDDLGRDLRGRAHDERIVAGNGLDQLLGRHLQLDVDLAPLVAEHCETRLGQPLGNQHLLRHNENHLLPYGCQGNSPARRRPHAFTPIEQTSL